MASEIVRDETAPNSKDVTKSQQFYAQIAYECPYVQPIILAALSSQFPTSSFTLVDSLPDPLNGPLLQILQYEKLAFALASQSPQTIQLNAYIIRKALIRKHFLAATISHWTKKHPTSMLQTNVKPMYELEVDYAEFLDEALVDAFELRDSLGANLERGPAEREWWILKPSMGDRGDGIRLFSTEEQLGDIFLEWEEEEEEEDDDDDHDDDDEPHVDSQDDSQKRPQEQIRTSQMRHFIAQPYIASPLLLPESSLRKFHVRTYAIAVGDLRVYVYKPMLALFAGEKYSPPWIDADLKAHLTNTCYSDGAVMPFWALQDDAPGLLQKGAWKEDVFRQICQITGEVFEAAARNMAVHFQAVPFAFEIFGLDFLVDAEGHAWLLEANAFPDFQQTGDGLKGIIAGLFEEVMNVAVRPFFLGDEPRRSDRLVAVLDINTGHK
jgi:tubulin---tyrosine ligase